MSERPEIDLRWGPNNALKLRECEKLVHFITAFIEPSLAPNDDTMPLGHYYALACGISHDGFHDYLKRTLNEKTHIRNAIFRATVNPDGFAGEYNPGFSDLTPREKMIVAVYCVNEIKHSTSKEFQESVFNVVKGKNKLPDEDDEELMMGISLHSYFLAQYEKYARWAIANDHTQKGRDKKNWDDKNPGPVFFGFFGNSPF